MAARIRNIKIDVVSYVEPAIYNGFNIAICKNSDTPLQSSVVTKYVKPEYNTNGTYSHTINNIVLDDADTYSIWVQNVGFGIDSMWRNNSGIEVPDDGVGTVASSFTPDDVQDALNEIDGTTSENIVKINPGNIGNNQINGNHIATTADIKLNEGGALTVGQNNVMLNSVSNDLIIAPDNGVVIGAPDLDGVDFCKLSQGNLNFMYWDGTEHHVYSSLRRVEIGLSVRNNSPVTIPGIWKEQPRILVSPADIMSYNKNYTSANQSLVCNAENIVRDGLSFKFTPVAYLRLTDGAQNTAINLGCAIYNNTREGDVLWPEYTSVQTAYSGYLSTPANTNSVTISGTVQGSCYGGAIGNSKETFTVNAYVEISGTSYHIGTYSTKNDKLNTWPFSTTISLPSMNAHSYRIKMTFQHDRIYYYVNGSYHIMGAVNATNITTKQGTFTSLAAGTLNYMAIGE